MVAPREGHLAAVVRIFAYIKKHLRSRIVFDPTERDFSNYGWIEADWKEFYPDAGEVIPGNAPEPRGQPIQLNMFCDAAHATCLETRRSTTVIVIFGNGTPLSWYSKRQNTIEASTFGSEFVALRIGAEIIEALR
jgi:hypothetical protein